MNFRLLCCVALGALLIPLASCERPAELANIEGNGAPAPKPLRPDFSRKSKRYSVTGAGHVGSVKVRAVGKASLTLFIDTNYAPLDVKGWQVRELPVVDMLANGDIQEWAGDAYAYGISDVQVGDIIKVGLRPDDEDGLVYVYEISIVERPGGVVPPSRRPGQLVHCPPTQFHASDCPYHVVQNVRNDLAAGRPVPEALLRFTGHLPKLPPANAVPDAIPPAKD